jgi:hypothetical protein
MKRALTLALVAGLLGAEGTALAAGDLDTCVDANEKAQKLRDEGKLRAAREQMLICARDVCPGPVKKDCTEGIEKLDAAAPTLVIGAKDAQGRDAVQVKVTVDGQPLTDKLDGKPVVVDPGEHTFRFEIAGAKPLEERLVIKTGEKNRVVNVSFGGETAPVPTPTPTPTQDAGGGAGFLPYALIGVGVVGLGMFTFFGLKGKGEIDDLKNSCGKTSSCAQSDVDDAKGKLIVADVSGALGLVAAGVGVYLLVTAKPAPVSVKTGSTRFDVAPLPGGGMAGLSGSF